MVTKAPDDAATVASVREKLIEYKEFLLRCVLVTRFSLVERGKRDGVLILTRSWVIG